MRKGAFSEGEFSAAKRRIRGLIVQVPVEGQGSQSLLLFSLREPLELPSMHVG